MPRGGSRPGERRGGRQKGTPNKRSLRLGLRAEAELTQARAAARADGKELLLAKDVLDNLMAVFLTIARRYAPQPGEAPPAPPEDRADEAAVRRWEEETRAWERRIARFERWALHARETAAKLAPYQSATFRAIAIAPLRDERPEGEVEVIHTMEQLREQLVIRGVPPEQLARVLTHEAVVEGDEGEAQG